MTSTIIFKTDSELKQKAQETAEELGLNLSLVLNNSLEKFVNEKYISFGNKYKNNNQNPYGIFKGANISEEDIKEVTDSWNDILNEF